MNSTTPARCGFGRSSPNPCAEQPTFEITVDRGADYSDGTFTSAAGTELRCHTHVDQARSYALSVKEIR